jgi:multiple sugar transport system permease protein
VSLTGDRQQTSAVDRHQAQASRRPRSRRRPLSLPYLLVLPVVALVGGLVVLPTVVTTIGAFRQEGGHGIASFGLGNFTSVFANSETMQQIDNTGLYVLFGVVLSTLFGLAIAVRLREPFRGRGLVLAVVLLPWAIPGVVEGIIWNWIYNPTFGVVDSVLKSLGLANGQSLLLGKDHLLTVFLIELSQVWQITPLSAIIILAGLQQIPRELTEAAQLDGCSRRRIMLRITLPLISTSVAIAAVQAVISSLNIFDQPYVLNGAAPLAAPITLQTYFLAFQDLNFNGAYALALLSTATTLVISVALVRLVGRKVEYS